MIIADITFSLRNILDEHLIIFLVGYSVVFFSLAFLYGVFYYVPKLLHLKASLARKNRDQKINDREKISSQEIPTDVSMTGEEAAAISMGLYLYINELHDEENRVLTIRKVSGRYSPWNSKIYSVTSGLNKRF
jgi:glutaconyl-CoA/methylmalonyl-CoA decarboxylase subunit delta